MRLLESKRYRDDLKKAISNTNLSELNNKSIFITGGLVFFVLNIIANNEMYGWIGFVICCVVTNILAYVLNTVKFKSCKMLRTLFGPMTT